ncbi:MAG: type VI secretion system baseplate subunit TssG [candidate division Zixibacteria bacterium]|nr:type VI secretion system baseplate subunit TssG [candidate division Zixibacteria bacterium]
MIYYGDNRMPDFCHRRYPLHFTTALIILMKMGVDINRLNILAVGEYENYKGEIIKQSPAPGSPLDRKTKITLHVGYSSPVDYMPYQFFYGLGGKRITGGEWEYNARILMAPFDAAVIRHLARAHNQVLKYNLGILDREYLSRYIGLFQFALNDDRVDFEELITWANILPDFNHWSGNPTRVTGILAALFKHPFKIIENVSTTYEIPTHLQYRLGSRAGRLGREMVLGNTFTECDSSYQVIMGDMEPDEITEYLPGKLRRKKLEWFLQTCMPSHLDYRICFRVKTKAVCLRSKDNRSRLGYSTVL